MEFTGLTGVKVMNFGGLHDLNESVGFNYLGHFRATTSSIWTPEKIRMEVDMQGETQGDQVSPSANADAPEFELTGRNSPVFHSFLFS